ncbi:hypothetical protein Moror_9264 [Moniliophthora roreri MCA 2997]|uniref:Uncharacterized protein n=1 Tax=Moniliophthora roreri (strain MCA 2997) TaxID=1381753 RepID=V2XZU7_MONRO|nr:hypothetical protein Moror_9264 [Moniliophthora roreri MCA 2997]
MHENIALHTRTPSLPPFNDYKLYGLPWQNKQEWKEFESAWLYDKEAWKREKAHQKEEWGQLPLSSPLLVSEESDREDYQVNGNGQVSHSNISRDDQYGPHTKLQLSEH